MNVASRVQGAAEPGQVWVSEDVWRQLRATRESAALDGAALDRSATGSAKRREVSTGPRKPSVAVLPFANMSPSGENEYFSDGVTEEILNLLAGIGGLKVISRTSIMRYKGTDKPMRQIGEELGVASILEGSVRQDEANAVFRRAIEIDPGYVGAHNNVADTYLCQRRYEDAIMEWETVSRPMPETLPPEPVAAVREGFLSGGERGTWEAYLEGLGSRPAFWVRDFDMAAAYAQLGRIDEAFALIDKLLAERNALAYQVPMDPLFDPLHSDPRWEKVLEQIGLR